MLRVARKVDFAPRRPVFTLSYMDVCDVKIACLHIHDNLDGDEVCINLLPEDLPKIIRTLQTSLEAEKESPS